MVIVAFFVLLMVDCDLVIWGQFVHRTLRRDLRSLRVANINIIQFPWSY